MAWPTDVTTRTVQFAAAFTQEEGVPLTIKAHTESTRSLTRASTGYLLEVDAAEDAATTPGQPLSIPLPITNQDGWLDAATGQHIAVGPEMHTHLYVTTVSLLDGSRVVGQYRFGPYPVPAGVGTYQPGKDVVPTQEGVWVPLPTLWQTLLDEAREIVEGAALPAVPASVIVVTGAEARPALPETQVVTWYETRGDDAARPANMGTYDLWVTGGTATPPPTGTAPVITTTSLGPLQVGVPFSLTLARTGTTPVTFTVVADALPAGLTLNPSTGAITGTPTTAGPGSVTARATNSVGTHDRVLAYNVQAAGPAPVAPNITTTSLGALQVGTPASVTLTTEGTGPITHEVLSGQLPAGMGLAGGVVSGTPNAAGSYTVTVRATGPGGTDDQVYAGTVAAAPVAYRSVWEDELPTVPITNATDAPLTVGTRYYSPTKRWRAMGIRVYENEYAPLQAAPAVTVTAYLQDYTGGAMNPPANWGAPAATKTHTGPRVVGQYTDILFDTPIVLEPVSAGLAGDVLLACYRFGNSGAYMAANVVGEDFRPDPHGDGVFMAENSAFNRSSFLYAGEPNVGGGGNSGAFYLVDVLYEIIS